MSILGPEVYRLPIARSYVSHWGMLEAIRELIQNALDSESPFSYEFDKEDDDTYTLVLRSEFTVLTPQTLLLGTTSKAGDPDSIGSFGEGYKIALLVLLREGYGVTMYNGVCQWIPGFVYDKRFGDELLAIEERPIKNMHHTGLTYRVSGLSEIDVGRIRQICLLMQDAIGERKVTTRGEILLDRPGKLYVGSLFVCETDLKYGYNVMSRHIKLERDRQTVSGWDLKEVVLKMWYDTKDFDRIAKMIEDDLPDVYHARYDSPEMVREACYRLFRKSHPGAVIAESAQELQQMVARGMERVVYVGGGMHAAVSRAPSYLREPKVVIQSPQERLREFLAKHKFNMHERVKTAFGALIDEAKGWQLK